MTVQRVWRVDAAQVLRRSSSSATVVAGLGDRQAPIQAFRGDAVEVTGDGYQLWDALVARTHLQNYPRRDGSPFWEWRPFTEIDASLPSYELRPLTDLHPAKNVDGDSARFLARGAMGPASWHEQDAKDRPVAHVQARLAVWDAALQRKFDAATEGGKPMQLSMGYTLDLDMTPGETPWGERYDAVQRNPRINHIAAVPLGRAGSAQVLLDAAAGWDLGQARTLADCSGKCGGVVYVDLGSWARSDPDRRHDATKFGDLLASLAKQKDVTAEELGKAAGIGASTVTQIMRGEIAMPPARRIEGFARALGVSVGRLTGALPKKEDESPMKVKFNIDGVGEVGLDLDAKATPQAIVKMVADAMNAGFAKFIKKKKGEEEEGDKKKAKKDAADLAIFAGRQDALVTAKTIIGIGYAGAPTELAINLDTIEAVDGKDARAEVEAMHEDDQPGAARMLVARAAGKHGRRDARALDLLGEINKRSGDRTDADKKAEADYRERTDAQVATAGMTPTERRNARAS